MNTVITSALAEGDYQTEITVRSGPINQTYRVGLSLAWLHLKINCGPNKVEGWEADGPYVKKGIDFAKYQPVAIDRVKNPAPERLYQTCRHQGPVFKFPDLPNGLYRVRLHFSDPAFPAGARESNRRMIIQLEGKTVLDQYDIVASAPGGFTADIREFQVKVKDGNGLGIVLLQGQGTDAFVCGLEIISEPDR
jgi:hypothetical protein